MNTKMLKIVALIFALILGMLVQIVVADDFDDAEVIDVGEFSYIRAPHVASFYYRIWFDDPGHELIVSLSCNTHYGPIDNFELIIYNPNKEVVCKKERLSRIPDKKSITEGKCWTVNERGWYYIQIQEQCVCDLNCTFDFTVTANPPNPDKFKVSGLSIVPEIAYEGEEIAISFDAKNNGQLSDTSRVELIIDGVTKDTKEVEIDGGETEKITFNIAADEEGTHNVVVSVSPIWSSISKEINGVYTVEHTPSPAEFEVSNLAIAPERVEIGDIVKITVDVANVGEVEGTYDVELHVDGRLEDSKMVTVSGGETKSVAFNIAEDYAGSYSVDVDGLSGAFEIVSPVSTPRATFTPMPTVKPASTSTQTSKQFTPTPTQAPIQTPITATHAPTPTPTKRPSSASVHLYGEKTDVVLGEDILLRLSAVNLIIKPPMSVQVIIIPPSGMSVTSAEFAETIAGQYSATYKLEPGKGRDVEVRIKSNQIGDFVVEGRIVYYFGDDVTTGEDHTLTLPIKVSALEPTPTTASGETTSGTQAQTKTPGFEVVFAIGAIAIGVVLLIKGHV